MHRPFSTNLSSKSFTKSQHPQQRIYNLRINNNGVGRTANIVPYILLIFRYGVAINPYATINLAIRSLFVQLWVANSGARDVIGQLWVSFGGVWQELFALWSVLHGKGKVYRGIRYFLNRLWVATFPLAAGLKRVWNRSKPLWNRVKEMLKWRFYVNFEHKLEGD